jgi:site-specific DNA-cytosine methylase
MYPVRKGEYSGALQAEKRDAVLVFRKAQRAHHAQDCETWVEAQVAPTCNAHDLEGSDIRATTIVSEVVADPVSANEGRTYTHEGKNNFRTHNVVVGDAPEAFSFKASHFTRGKDGEPSAIMPPLSADADKGDQDAVIFQPQDAPADRQVAGTVEATIGRSRGAGTPVPMIAVVPSVAGTLGSSGGAERGWNNDLDGSGAFPVEHVAPTMNGTQRQQVDGAMAVDSSVGIPRRLMPLETERLQGWDDYWTDIPKKTILNRSDAAAAGVLGEIEYDFPSDAKRYRAVGNGVAKPVAQWIAWRIRLAAAEAYLTLSSQQESHE